MRKHLVLLLVLAFTLICAENLLAARDLNATTATVVKIQGNEITLRDDQGMVSTVRSDSTGIRVGQTVSLQNGRIADSTPAPSSVQTTKPEKLSPGNPVGINPQPEPPGKNF